MKLGLCDHYAEMFAETRAALEAEGVEVLTEVLDVLDEDPLRRCFRASVRRSGRATRCPLQRCWRHINGVRFEATSHAELLPGFLLTGLSLESSVKLTGTVEWATVGDDIRYDGKVAGPGFIGTVDVKPAPIDVDVTPTEAFPRMREMPMLR